MIKSFANIRYCSIQYHLCTVALVGIALISISHYKKMFSLEEEDKEKLNYDFNREVRMNHMIN